VPSIPCVDEKVVGGIDTHKDLHFAAVVHVTGELLGERAFAHAPGLPGAGQVDDQLRPRREGRG
jgi:hypothetical protein